MRESRPLVATIAVVLLAVVGSALSAARAGSIEVVVRERDGAAVPRQAVDLLRVEPERDLAATRLFSMPVARGTTDARGRAVFEGLPPGSYTAAPRDIGNPSIFFASPENPLRSVGAATLVKPEDRGTLEIVLDRGTWVSFDVLFDGTPFPRGLTVSLERPGIPAQRLLLDEAGRGTTQLSAGRWVVVLQHSPGLTLAAVEVDGAPVDPLHVAVEIETPSSSRHVVFTLAAPCKVVGNVVFTGGPPGVQIEGTRLTAGTTPGEVRARANVDKQGNYVLFLTDGVWSVQPVGDRIVESRPAATTVSLAVGQEGRADFVVKMREREDLVRLLVVVSDPEGRPVPGARVEAWPAADLHPQGAPLATAITTPWGGGATLLDLPPGSYRLVAGALGVGTGSTILSGYDPSGEDARADVTLRGGGTVRARAVDEAGRPVAGVVLRLAAAEAPSIDGFSAEGSLVSAGARARTAPTDREGRLELRGVAPGRWEAKADPPDETRTVQVSPDLEVGVDQVVEVELRVARAASLTASLRCTDRGPIPERVDARVVSGSRPETLERTVVLAGDARDRLAIGPLEPGEYRLAVRPQSFDAWTYAPGTESADEATPFRVEKGEAAGAGTVHVRCEPAVALVFSVRSREPLPDLARSVVQATWVPDPGPGARDPVSVPSEIDSGRIVVRPLPTGAGRLDVAVLHPYFLPGGEVRGSFPLTLARGKIASVPLAIASIGGAIVARGGIAARLQTPRGESRLDPAERGAVTFPALPPGAYRVDVCADTTCVRVVRSFDPVTVTAGATSEVVAAPSEITSGATSPRTW